MNRSQCYYYRSKEFVYVTHRYLGVKRFSPTELSSLTPPAVIGHAACRDGCDEVHREQERAHSKVIEPECFERARCQHQRPEERGQNLVVSFHVDDVITSPKEWR